MALRVEHINIDITRGRGNMAGAPGAASAELTGAQELELKLQQLGSKAQGLLTFTGIPVNNETFGLDDGDGNVRTYKFLTDGSFLNGEDAGGGDIAVDLQKVAAIVGLDKQLAFVANQVIKAITVSNIKINAKLYEEQDTIPSTTVQVQLIHAINGTVGNQSIVEAATGMAKTDMAGGGNPPNAANTLDTHFFTTEGTAFVIIWDDAFVALRTPATESGAFPPT